MEICKTNLKFNSSIVEIQINKEFEEKVQEEFTRYNRINKPGFFKSFIDYFMKDKENDNVNIKVMRMITAGAK